MVELAYSQAHTLVMNNCSGKPYLADKGAALVEYKRREIVGLAPSGNLQLWICRNLLGLIFSDL